MVNKKWNTVIFHIDDPINSNIDSKLNDLFLKCLNKMYVNYWEVQATCGKVHEYFGITINFSDTGKVKIDMVYCIRNMIDGFSKISLANPQCLQIKTYFLMENAGPSQRTSLPNFTPLLLMTYSYVSIPGLISALTFQLFSLVYRIP